MSDELVLVTGGSGFLGAHCILALVRAGYRVRATVRSLRREPEVRAMLTVGGLPPAAPLSFVEADLLSDVGWQDAVAGCKYVLHVASPFPERAPKHEDELIRPAREGALRVLRASRDAAVSRVVMTSSFAAIGYGQAPRGAAFTEADWTNVDGHGVTPYAKSKTLAERAAWDFMANEGGDLQLAVVNPVGILGPVLGPDYATSILIVQRLMDRAMPACPKIHFGVVDVRDVADLHVLAMRHPAANGERFLAVAGEITSIVEIARLLKARMGAAGRRVPTGELPDWVLRLAALRDPALKLILPELGNIKRVSGEKARRVLGWMPRSNEEAILATAESLLRLGLLKHAPQPVSKTPNPVLNP